VFDRTVTETMPVGGAYGLAIVPPHDVGRALVDAPASWQRWRFEYTVGGFATVKQSWSSTSAAIKLAPDGLAVIDRAASLTRLVVPRTASADAFVHPHISSTAVVVGQWLGRATFHASSFVRGGGVWAVLGDKLDGKSSTVAWALSRRMPVMADDLLVTANGLVFAGPRCLDLREGAAQHFGLGRNIGEVGDRCRWRVDLEPIDPELALQGWISLAWAADIGVRQIGARERFTTLVRHRAFRLTESDPSTWTRLLGLPMYEFRRPRSWDQLDVAMETLLGCLPHQAL
jgi:hypothetical protein